MNHTQEADERSFYDTDLNTGADSEDYDENDDDEAQSHCFHLLFLAF